MIDLAEEMFSMPVRIGTPRYHGGLEEVVKGPRHATAVGLLFEGMAQRQQMGRIREKTGRLGTVTQRMKTWFAGNF